MKELNGKTIADNIRAERNRANLSQKEVADFIGVTRLTYIEYEKDASLIKTTTMLKLSKLFKCNISDFYMQK